MDASNDTLKCNVCDVQLEEREYIFDEVSQKEKLIITLPTKISQDDDPEYMCWDCHERITNYYEFAQNIILNSKKNCNKTGINSLFEVDENDKIKITAISNLYSDMIHTCPNCKTNLKILVKNNPEDCYYPFQISLIVVDQTGKLILDKNIQACENKTELVKGICRNKLNVEDKFNKLCGNIVKNITNHNEQNIDKMQDSSSMLQEDINFVQNVSEHSKENLNTTHTNSLEDNKNEEMMTLSKLYNDIIYTCPKCYIDLMILIKSNREDCDYPFQISLVIVDIVQSSLKDETYSKDTMELVNGAYNKELNVKNESQESLLNQDITSDIIIQVPAKYMEHEEPSTNKIHGTVPMSQKGITFQKRKILRQKGRRKKIRKNRKSAENICIKERDSKMDINETSDDKVKNQEKSAVNCSICGESVTMELDPDAINDLITCAGCEDSTLSLMVDGYEAKAIARRQYKCSMCPKRFSRKQRLEFHEMRHNENMDEFVCSTCKHEFSAENSLYEHYLFVHKGVRPHICELCGKSYQIKARLKEHLRTHTGEKPYQCNVCGLRCRTINALKGHRKSHFSSSRHTCNICNKSYSKKQNMNEHLEKHWKMDKNISLPRLFTCPLCNEGLPTYRLLKNHMLELHQIDCKDPLVTSQQPLYECNECNEKFKHQMSLKAHKQKVHERKINPTFECDICKAIFRVKQMLITHIKNKHGGKKRYKCAKCGKGFSGTKSLYNHILLHTGRKPFSCEYCNMSFRRKDSRDLHHRKHTNEQPFQCQDCGQSFFTYNSRSKHRKKEHGVGKIENVEKCPECGEKCNNQQEVRIHLNKHLGEKLNELLRITRRVSRTNVK